MSSLRRDQQIFFDQYRTDPTPRIRCCRADLAEICAAPPAPPLPNAPNAGDRQIAGISSITGALARNTCSKDLPARWDLQQLVAIKAK